MAIHDQHADDLVAAARRAVLGTGVTADEFAEGLRRVARGGWTTDEIEAGADTLAATMRAIGSY